MPDSVFHESMGRGITCVIFRLLFVFYFFFVYFIFRFWLFGCLFLLPSDTSVFLRIKDMNQFYHYNIIGRRKILNLILILR